MKVIVMGAGISGCASAWYLAKAGHEVTVIDRLPEVAQATSFANAGQLSFGYTTPWAAPGMLLKAAKWMLKEHSPLIMRPDGSLFQLQWLLKMAANCNSEAYVRNQSRMMRISEYSREQFRLFEQGHNIDFQQRHQGLLHLFRDKELFDRYRDNMKVLEQFNVPYQILNPDECLQYEPALAHMRHNIGGAFRLPNDSTGDCRVFAEKLAAMCRESGVQFEFGVRIDRLNVSGSRIQSVQAVKKHGGEPYIEEMTADLFLTTLGCDSRFILQQIGLDLPIYPIKGYSLTVPLTNEQAAPQSTILDEKYKIALTRLGNRIRVGGMAEVSGYHIRLPQVHRETLTMVTEELFPSGGDTAKAVYWSGLRPMTPDSTPIIGATRFGNLFINAGHGTLGWTMSLGAGKIIADLMSSGRAEVQTDDLSLARYQS